MAFPLTALRTYVNNSTPAVDASDLNSIQEGIYRLYGATWSIKSLYIDGAGGAAVTPKKGRLTVSGGTALVAGDITIGGAWGVGATVVVVGTDARGTLTFTAAGAPAPDPDFTLTFKDLSWTTAPLPLCNFTTTNDGTVPAANHTRVHTITDLAFTVQWKGHTPVAGNSYAFHYHVIG